MAGFRGGYLGDTYRPQATQLYQGLRASGLSHLQAAGFMGNFQEESGLNTNAYNKKEDAIGVAQWRFGRRDNLKAFAAQNGTDWRDPFIQGKFAGTEIQTVPEYAGAWRRLQAAQTPGQAAGAVIGWEKPKGYNLKTGDPTGVPSYRDRVGHADAFHRILGGGDGAQVGPTVEAGARGFLAQGAAPGPTQARAAGMPMPPPRPGDLGGTPAAAPAGGDTGAVQPLVQAPAAPAQAPAYNGGLLGLMQGSDYTGAGAGKDLAGKLGDMTAGQGGGQIGSAISGIMKAFSGGDQPQQQERPIVVNPDNVNVPNLQFAELLKRRNTGII